MWWSETTDNSSQNDDPVVSRIEQIRSEILHDMRQRPDDPSAGKVWWPVAILPGWLYVGGAMAAQDEDFLRVHNIRHVLNCADGGAKGHVEDRRYLELRAEDDDDYPLLEKHMQQSHEFLLTSKGEPVLVHCYAGQNRSVGLVVSYLIMYGLTSGDNHQKPSVSMPPAMTLEDAVRHVFERRPYSLSNPSFVKQLAGLEETLKHEQSEKSTTAERKESAT